MTKISSSSNITSGSSNNIKTTCKPCELKKKRKASTIVGMVSQPKKSNTTVRNFGKIEKSTPPKEQEKQIVNPVPMNEEEGRIANPMPTADEETSLLTSKEANLPTNNLNSSTSVKPLLPLPKKQPKKKLNRSTFTEWKH